MKRSMLVVAALAAAALGLGACSTSNNADPASTAPSCPTSPVPVTVSVNQWGDIVSQLAGQCGDVSEIISSATVGDPHDFEPTASDIAKFGKASLVVINGAGYDEWARKAVAANGSSAPVVDAATVNNVATGSNPHLWYDPTYVVKTADAVTAELKKVLPGAAAYFDAQRSQFETSLAPYFAEIAAIKSKAAGKEYLATESVFDYMASACGLTNITPTGYQNSTANESEPSPADIAAFAAELTSKKATVLINNIQTQGAVPEAFVGQANSAGVPVVGVTESIPDNGSNFQQWQTAQLQELARALGVT